MTKNKKIIKFQPLSLEKYIKEHARKLPFGPCRIVEENGQGLFQIVVTRQKRNGSILAGIYLIDAFCLGLKNTFYYEFEDLDEFEDFTKKLTEHESGQIEADVVYAQNLIYGAIEFAEDAGFRPQKDFKISEYILDDVENLEYVDITFGKNGVHFYMDGHYDDVKSILGTLDRNLGAEIIHMRFYMKT
jgi:hypothetical protein